MTQDEIIEMAKQAGCFEKHQVFYFTSPELEAFAKLVAQHEREACAKMCESLFDMDDESCNEAEQCAKAIRVRGQA